MSLLLFGRNNITGNEVPNPAVRDAAGLQLGPEVTASLRSLVHTVAEDTVSAITVEVPGYAGALAGQMGANIQQAVEMALGGFLRLAEQSAGSDASTPLGPALDAAYALGRGEARSGRTMDALLAAYRVGARVSWRQFSDTVVAAGLPATTLARFAELVFAYIDALSAASVSGHADELATTGLVRQRYLERLGQHLLAGASAEVLSAAAEKADWPEPRSLTSVLLPTAQARTVLGLLHPATLQPTEELAGVNADEETAVLFVPDMDGSERARLLRLLHGRSAVVGPARGWSAVRASYQRALRARELVPVGQGDAAVDTEEHLVDLVLTADREAFEDLRWRALSPLAGVRPASAEKLAQTLRSWLLHQGRRDDVASDLFVHAQTVRYRMGQLRDLFGDRLQDPQAVLELSVALRDPLPAAEYWERRRG